MIELMLILSIVVSSALASVISKNIIYATVFLLCTNVSLGIAYYMIGAPTVALFQLAIFAGAVVVFFVIAMMLTRSGDMTLEDEAEVSE